MYRAPDAKRLRKLRAAPTVARVETASMLARVPCIGRNLGNNGRAEPDVGRPGRSKFLSDAQRREKRMGLTRNRVNRGFAKGGRCNEGP